MYERSDIAKRPHLMTKLRYSLPFPFLALVPLGLWLGGLWTFIAAVLTPLTLVALDITVGAERGGELTDAHDARALPRFYILMQLAVIATGAWRMAQSSLQPIESVGLVTSTGVTAGVFGFLAAHEMIHSADRRERALGLTFLASVFYMHFRIAHIFGHHSHAATPEDAATARLGEGLYAFLGRTIPGQFREAWRSERRRLQRRGRQPLRPGNRVALYALIELAIMAALAFISWRALAFVFGTAAIAVVLLESFNYVAHYGLTRQSLPGGRYEALGPQHSWNSGRWMNNAALFNMGRHSDHHRKTTRPFDQLTAVNDQAELPFGYAGAILTAFIPPLWRRIMDPRAAAAMGGYLPSEPSVPVR